MKKTRKCLKCQKDFKSKGAHNRICPVCAKGNQTTFDKDVFLIKNDHIIRKTTTNAA